MSYESTFKDEINKRISDGYPESKAIISYFLNIYFKLDYGDERDFICDGTGDKGIDAIFVDNESKEIYFIQSKFSFKNPSTREIGFDSQKFIGDSEPKEFIGSLSQFSNKEQIESIINDSTTGEELNRMLKEFNISDKIESYSKIPMYITTRYIGLHTQALIDIHPNIIYFTPLEFEEEHSRYTGLLSENRTDIDMEFTPIGNIINAPHSSIICMMKVKDLVEIDGIRNYSLFHRNVRSWLGRNKVYKSIKQNLHNSSFNQSNNILMHNGITIVGRTVEFNESENKVFASNISIVNGCQSTFAYFENRDKLTEDNTILVKIIPEAEHEERLGKEIVYYSNNQSSVKISDLVSLTDNAQVIQKQFSKNNSEYYLKIKAGNNIIPQGKVEVKLELLAQYVASFFNLGHISASNKNKLLETSFYEVFNRKLTYIHYEIVLSLESIISCELNRIKNQGTNSEKVLLHTYFLTKLFILNILKRIYKEVYDFDVYEINLKKDTFDSEEYHEKIKLTINSIIVEIDDYLEANDILSNYKNLLKNKEESEKIYREILKSHKKDIRKDSKYSLAFGD